MSAAKEDTLKQFCDVTGADESRSRFFLESSNWQLEVALSSFYEHGGNADASGAAPSNAQAAAALSDSDMDSPPVSPFRPQKKDKKPKQSSNQKFATLSSLQQDEDSSDEEEGQAFYAGGSDRSGQQIIGPGKGKKDVVTEVFKSVRERGAVMFEDEPSSTSRGNRPFGGAGYRLGQTNDDHEQVAPAAGSQSAQEGPRSVRLRLYRSGFTVDAGALRRYSDPEHAEFLNCIRRGEIPAELSEAGGEVRVTLEDRRHEECPTGAPAAARAFSGKGHLLGSPTPPTVGATAPVAADVQDAAANERAAIAALNLDETQPVTSIQFRLPDGSRLAGRFNHTHTVGQLRQYIVTALPIYQLRPFVLQTTFPSAELTDDSQTVKEANLLNSVCVVRLK
ncbi:NSFL1 cofactor p47 isoform X2 [Plutella xylostella]|uniref:NSFL1 cofactor p47 isoform X1 n=1 Tax=Plutella xylostella TaxID=51655 RepID=UPI0005D07DF7|nr:NSFL1 cofactor p47 isoform X1 [Plutella xylostella]XP_048487259.1 NSFL1 cofactor p47 isoform X2 [Plutella xylostella]